MAAHGAGAHSFFRYLQLHPKILPTRSENFDYVTQHPVSALVKKSLSRGEFRSGWVYCSPDLLLQDSSVAEKLAQYSEPNVLFQLIRDPIRLILSVYNQQVQKAILGAVQHPPKLNEFIDERMQYCFFHKAGSMVADHFENWVLIDTSDISGDATSKTMRMVCERLKLACRPEYYEHPALLQPQNDELRFILRLFRFPVNVAGVELQCILQAPGSLDNFGPDEAPVVIPPNAPPGVLPAECEIGRIDEIPESLAAFRRIGPLRIMSDAGAWVKFHPKTRQILLEDNTIGRGMAPQIIDALMKNHEKLRAFQKITAEDLDSQLIMRIKTYLADDVRKLFERAPRLRQVWDLWADV